MRKQEKNSVKFDTLSFSFLYGCHDGILISAQIVYIIYIYITCLRLRIIRNTIYKNTANTNLQLHYLL